MVTLTQVTSQDLDRFSQFNEDQYVGIDLTEVVGDSEYVDSNKIEDLAEAIIKSSERGRLPIKLIIDSAEWGRWAVNCDERADLNRALYDRGYVMRTTESLTENRGCDGLLCLLEKNPAEEPASEPGEVEDPGYAHYILNPNHTLN